MRQFALDVAKLVSVYAVCACEASRGCGELQCGARANGSAASSGCCDVPARTFAEHASWLARKLSGLLILLALFAVGYFVQRLVCPRHRRRGRAQPEPESLLGARATASQDALLERLEDGGADGGVDGFASPVLQPPAYDEVKDLPSYEESVRAAAGSVRPQGASRERPEAARIFRNSV
ncbi:uncharacterized membrane protein C3orf80 homolog [Silurus meridionalis]|uniref:uncharacterized membrane protein C3orf80 homolog n=1 Tax=Silurus meridionalis TaxID=175797 RepID=UPI001EEBCAEB|nr:uncharacterized membrane protein C3orf80 homolog [Silurus meridionalis]XP_046731874.1 uncharacterized membrane protein C3orf80 homolog [Silurus meridionalis]XP_046731875.1 uncharacterized membrane protein C3orf80 homolog [Silurus meridionalis]KAI5093030.1 hypothetical protein C0J45_17421 [Silurus meridionalis]